MYSVAFKLSSTKSVKAQPYSRCTEYKVMQKFPKKKKGKPHSWNHAEKLIHEKTHIFIINRRATKGQKRRFRKPHFDLSPLCVI